MWFLDTLLHGDKFIVTGVKDSIGPSIISFDDPAVAEDQQPKQEDDGWDSLLPTISCGKPSAEAHEPAGAAGEPPPVPSESNCAFYVMAAVQLDDGWTRGPSSEYMLPTFLERWNAKKVVYMHRTKTAQRT